MASFKTNITKLAATVIEDALRPGVNLDTRIAALKAATPLFLGDARVRAQLKMKGIEDDDESDAKVADFGEIRKRVRAADKH